MSEVERTAGDFTLEQTVKDTCGDLHLFTVEQAGPSLFRVCHFVEDHWAATDEPGPHFEHAGTLGDTGTVDAARTLVQAAVHTILRGADLTNTK